MMRSFTALALAALVATGATLSTPFAVLADSTKAMKDKATEKMNSGKADPGAAKSAGQAKAADAKAGAAGQATSADTKARGEGMKDAMKQKSSDFNANRPTEKKK